MIKITLNFYLPSIKKVIHRAFCNFCCFNTARTFLCWLNWPMIVLPLINDWCFVGNQPLIRQEMFYEEEYVEFETDEPLYNQRDVHQYGDIEQCNNAQNLFSMHGKNDGQRVVEDPNGRFHFFKSLLLHSIAGSTQLQVHCHHFLVCLLACELTCCVFHSSSAPVTSSGSSPMGRWTLTTIIVVEQDPELLPTCPQRIFTSFAVTPASH